MDFAPDLQAIALRSGSMAFLVVEEQLSLIDAGFRGSRPAIERVVIGLGRRPEELARIICTHGHPDHAGGAADYADDDVEVYLHPADAEAIRVGPWDVLRRPTRGRLFAAMTPILEGTRPLHDGDVLPLLGGLIVVHTPGHTPGSVCLYAPRDRLLFSGDVLEVRRGRVTYASRLFSTDVAAARRSMQRLAELDVKTIVFSHFPPWHTAPTGCWASSLRGPPCPRESVERRAGS
jgi:glyoxylase-like metal-dependent hydrolase (beta-lactamase superfamily II)